MKRKNDPFFLAPKKRKIVRKEHPEDSAKKGEDNDMPFDTKGAEMFATTPEEHKETKEERKVRLARQYIDAVRGGLGEDADDKDLRSKLVADAREQGGKNIRYIAEKLETLPEEIGVTRSPQRQAVTCCVMSDDGSVAFTGSKDGTIVRWDVAAKKAVFVTDSFKYHSGKGTPHIAAVLALALSSDGKMLVSGGQDKAIHLWSVDYKSARLEHLDTLVGHKDAVTGLAFRQGTKELFSCSADRTVKVWNTDSRAYIETLFGHLSPVTGIDALDRERCVTSGGLDGSARLWKVPEQSQLVYRTHNIQGRQATPLDCISLVSESAYVTGAQDGSVALWHAARKAPVDLQATAHAGAWVPAVCVCRKSDLAVSGGSDGTLRFWRVGRARGPDGAFVGQHAVLTEVGATKVPGCVNGLHFSRDGQRLVVAVGRDHRLGAWERRAGSKNGVIFIELTYKE